MTVYTDLVKSHIFLQRPLCPVLSYPGVAQAIHAGAKKVIHPKKSALRARVYTPKLVCKRP